MIGQPNLTTDDVFRVLECSKKPLQEWGRAFDGTLMFSAKTGGTKLPAIFITAGAHSIETAGVHAALDLLQTLDTEHQVFVLPLRDPFGFAGVQHCLSFAAGILAQVSSHEEILDFLLGKAILLHESLDFHLFLLGEIGFVWSPRKPGLEAYWEMENGVLELSRSQPDVTRCLWGKRVMLVNPSMVTEGAAEMQRCWHAFFSSSGEWMHLNRMFGRLDAPPEVTAVDRLVSTVKPGLTCDLHEGNGSGFWLPIPKPQINPELSFLMARAFFDYIEKQDYPITRYEEWLETDRTPQTAINADWMLPDDRRSGLFWVNTLLRGEGHNLMSYVEQFGLPFGTEGPMSQPLRMRLDGIAQGIKAAIRVWETNQV